MYRRVVYPLFQRIEAERAHDAVLRLLAQLERSGVARRLLARLLAADDPRLHVTAWGLDFANPLGIAAGLDKNAVAVQTWGALGFGHVEVGTVTPQPQSGNPQPRVFRLAADRAIINRMGFPGGGAAVVRRRLGALGQPRPVVGVNLGANKRSVEAGTAVADYVAALEELYDVADYLTLNISSPNTTRLRALQGRAALSALVREVVARRDAFAVRRPLLVKVAPDLTPAELDDIVAVCVERGIDGLIATNTTLARPDLLQSAARAEAGGLSGAPLRDRATDIIRYVHLSAGARLPLIGVGGVFTADDVLAKLRAGATLVQLYTGVVYEGPLVAARIKRELRRRMDRVGAASLAELVAATATG